MPDLDFCYTTFLRTNRVLFFIELLLRFVKNPLTSYGRGTYLIFRFVKSRHRVPFHFISSPSITESQGAGRRFHSLSHPILTVRQKLLYLSLSKSSASDRKNVKRLRQGKSHRGKGVEIEPNKRNLIWDIAGGEEHRNVALPDSPGVPRVPQDDQRPGGSL
jgi:hypothetical protein